jgi:hypothetical protein
MSIEESALVVVVPEAEPLVGPWRSRFDPAATYGVPAHVTVLYPFVPPALLDDAVSARLQSLFTGFRGFDFRFETTARFNDTILYLVPSPEEPFDQLTHAVYSAFPQYPPYEGRFAKVVAHLTVADHATPEELDDAEGVVRQGLGIMAKATNVLLLVGRDEPGTWKVRETFPLGRQS